MGESIAQAKVALQEIALSWLRVVERDFPGKTDWILAQTAGMASASTNKFNGIDLSEGETSVLENLGEGSRYMIKDMKEAVVSVPSMPDLWVRRALEG